MKCSGYLRSSETAFSRLRDRLFGRRCRRAGTPLPDCGGRWRTFGSSAADARPVFRRFRGLPVVQQVAEIVRRARVVRIRCDRGRSTAMASYWNGKTYSGGHAPRQRVILRRLRRLVRVCRRTTPDSSKSSARSSTYRAPPRRLARAPPSRPSRGRHWRTPLPPPKPSPEMHSLRHVNGRASAGVFVASHCSAITPASSGPADVGAPRRAPALPALVFP